jgi:hypothetical protein
VRLFVSDGTFGTGLKERLILSRVGRRSLGAVNLTTAAFPNSRKIFAILFSLFLAGLFLTPEAEAQNGTTPASLILSTTFQSISVKAPFSGDANANNSALIQYRPTGTTTFLNAYTPFIDRRATLGSVTNPYNSQARGSIVGLMPNTSYDVQVTWTDPDGVTPQPAIATISTLSYTPPTGGSTVTVNNSTTFASALSTVNAGQTIHLNAAAYSAFTVSR